MELLEHVVKHSAPGYRSYYKVRYGNRRAHGDYISVKPYSHELYTSINYDAPNSTAAYLCQTDFYGIGARVANEALARLEGKLGSNASLGNAIAESGETLGMIAGTAKTLLRAYRGLRKGDWRAVKSLPKVTAKDAKKAIKQAVTNIPEAWLSLSYGWIPLHQDIEEGIEVLSRDFSKTQPQRIFAGKRRTLSITQDSQGLKTTVHYGVRIFADFCIENPNAALRYQAGLANPLAALWEVVPFSFVVDWWLKVDRYIGNLDRFWGYGIARPCTSIYREGSTHGWADGTALYVRREPSLPAHQIQSEGLFEAFSAHSWKRAANAVSLLAIAFKNQQ